MPGQPNILAISKRTANLCATQSLLYAAGYKLVVATNIFAARSLIRSLRLKAVIVCRESWSSDELQEIASELINVADMPVLMHCPGCTGCDEAAGKPGTLQDARPLTKLMATVDPLKR